MHVNREEMHRSPRVVTLNLREIVELLPDYHLSANLQCQNYRKNRLQMIERVIIKIVDVLLNVLYCFLLSFSASIISTYSSLLTS